MATVNKDFKIKSGLIVEGTTGTINGNNILTENSSDSYIINLIGGETLVTSVDSTQLQVVDGELSVKSNVFDADGAAATAEDNANSYTNQEITTALNTAQGYADTAETDAKAYADNLASNYDPAGAASGALDDANSYTDNQLESYTPTSSLDTTVGGYGYLKSADLSGYATESYVGTAIDNLVDGAPGLLDTLNEIAAAINDDDNYATTMTTALAGKQDNLTASTGITIDGSNNISVTTNTYDAYGDADTAEQNAKDYADSLASNYDPAGSAQGAYDNAVAYVGNLTTDDVAEGNNVYFTEARVNDILTTSTQTNISITEDINGHLVITAENGVDDSTTDDLAEGEDNLYFTNTRVIDAVDNADITPNTVQIDTFRKEEATQTYFASASTATVHSFGYPFGSVKYVVRVVGNVSGTLHSQVTEILATVDGNNNVAVTEFGSIHTTEPALASFTVDYDGVTSEFRLRATTANSGSEVIVAATLLSWAD